NRMEGFRSRSSPGLVGRDAVVVVLGTPPLSSGLRVSPALRQAQGLMSGVAFTVGGCMSIAFQSGRTGTVGIPERLAGRLAPSVPGCAHRALPHRSSACVQLELQHSGTTPAHVSRFRASRAPGRTSSRLVIVTVTTGEHDAIRVAVSTVIFSLRTAAEGDRLMLPLVRRTRDRHLGTWALPGGWLDPAEDLDAAASRTLAKTTALKPSCLEQLYTFGDVDHAPTRAISIVYWALRRSDLDDAQRSASRAPENVEWLDVE